MSLEKIHCINTNTDNKHRQFAPDFVSYILLSPVLTEEPNLEIFLSRLVTT